MEAVLIDSDGYIRNIIEYDPDGDYEPPTGLTIHADINAPIGSRWDGMTVTLPPSIVPKPSEVQTLEAVAFVARNSVKTSLKANTFDISNTPKVSALFPSWSSGLTVNVGDIYTYSDLLVEVIQAHITQADWAPDVTPALWKVYRAPDAVTEWVQPTGSTDAYAKGAKVTHNGKTWSSNVDANVWEPPTQWTEVTA